VSNQSIDAFKALVSMLSALYRPPVRPTHGRISHKRLEILWNFHRTVAPSI